MLEIILMLLIAHNTVNGINNEIIINAYKDYKTTTKNVNTIYQLGDKIYILSEANPIAREIFEYINYNPVSLDLLGSSYLIAINYLPHSKILTKLISIAHFYGAYTWRNAPIQINPDIIYVSFTISF